MPKRTTAIRWAHHTWNPVHGCSKVSPGCQHCYAERISRENGFTLHPWTEPNAKDNVQMKPHKLTEPDRIHEPARIFVNSMSDLFHGMIPDDYIQRVCEVMARNTRHVFMVLTKRPERARFFAWPFGGSLFEPSPGGSWPTHVWLGTSVETQRTADERIPHLLKSFAQVRFLSMEPMLEPINLAGIAGAEDLDLIIVGGESGTPSRRREMSHAWVWPIRDFCTRHGIAFYFKQSSATRTEIGKSLIHEDGTAWTWEQYPGDLRAPEPATPHKHAHWEALPLSEARRQ